MVDHGEENAKQMLIWDQFLAHLQQSLGKETVERWVRPLKILRFDAANIYLEAEHSFQISWFEEHVRPELKKLANNNGRPMRVHISTPPSAPPVSNTPPPSAPESSIAPDSLDPDMTLENFLPTHPSHKMAIDLVQNIVKNHFNPIFFYGGSWTGKTHLLTAAAFLLRKAGLRPFYIHARNFTEHVIQSIRKGTLGHLRAQYRSADALLIDDVHDFSKKFSTQEELFHTFNELHTRGCPIVLSSQCLPGLLMDVEPRLISRFEWGILEPLKQGDWAPILRQKAVLWKLSVQEDLFTFLLEKFPARPLHALQTLAMRAATATPIRQEEAEVLLKDLLQKETASAPTPEKIIKTVASHYGICSTDILGKSQTRDMAFPRQIAMYLCREKLKLSFQKIGEIFGRDHSTVMASVRHIEKGVEEKLPELRELPQYFG